MDEEYKKAFIASFKKSITRHMMKHIVKSDNRRGQREWEGGSSNGKTIGEKKREMNANIDLMKSSIIGEKYAHKEDYC